MENQIQIRPATQGDIPFLLAFEQGVIAAERTFDETLKDDPVHYYDLKKLISSEGSTLLVAETDGRVIASGYARIQPAKPYLKHERYAYLGFMFVVPEWRGKGLNGKMIDALRKWAGEKGVEEIRLEVFADNAPAIRAYEKAGFRKNLVEMRLARKKEG
ncbi:MAG: GNAT family N-acetyltransferase [Mucilaginibacter polytrichastri]|nr:GNAT family N-acetyltransferase [Mucilaginibacter polytrichastri]